MLSFGAFSSMYASVCLKEVAWPNNEEIGCKAPTTCFRLSFPLVQTRACRWLCDVSLIASTPGLHLDNTVRRSCMLLQIILQDHTHRLIVIPEDDSALV